MRGDSWSGVHGCHEVGLRMVKPGAFRMVWW